MAHSTLDRVLSDINELKPNELAQVRNAVDNRLAPADSQEAEEQFLHSLLQAGLIDEIKTPKRVSKLDRPMAPIIGKPLSETIIEDRR